MKNTEQTYFTCKKPAVSFHVFHTEDEWLNQKWQTVTKHHNIQNTLLLAK